MSVLCVTAVPPPVAAQPSGVFTFQKVAAVGDTAPGSGGLVEFLGAPSLDRGQVAFRAVAVEGSSGRLGIFTSDKAGTGATMLDTLTPGKVAVIADIQFEDIVKEGAGPDGQDRDVSPSSRGRETAASRRRMP